MNQAMQAGSALAVPVKQTVTDQLRDARESMVNLLARMDSLIQRTGINVVNELNAKSAAEPPQSSDTRSVTSDISVFVSRLHSRMDTLDGIA